MNEISQIHFNNLFTTLSERQRKTKVDILKSENKLIFEQF